MHQSVATISNPEFINLQPIDVNPLMSKCEIKVFYLGENRNRSFISKEVAIEMSKTLRGAPIVGYFIESKQDFGDHGEQVIIDAEGIKFNKLTKPYGFVDPSSPVWFQEFEDTDDFGNKTIRTYLMCKGYLWTKQYEEAQKVIEESRPQSMELDKDTLDGSWAKNSNSGIEFFIINDAIFSQLCILGEEVEPCFEGASVTSPQVSSSFTMDEEFTQTLYTMMKQLREFTLSQNNEGGNSMEEVTQSVETTEVEVSEPVVEETPQVETETEVVETEAQVEEFTQSETTESQGPQSEAEFKKDEEDDKDEDKDDSDDSKEPDDEDEDDDKKKPSSQHTLDEYSRLAVEYTKLQNEYSKLEAKYTALENENKGLVEFKNKVEDEKKTDLINSFYMLSDEDKKDVIENKSKYSLDDIEAKLSVICVRKKVNFEKEEVGEAQPPLTFSLENDGEAPNQLPAWLKAVENFKNSSEN